MAVRLKDTGWRVQWTSPVKGVIARDFPDLESAEALFRSLPTAKIYPVLLADSILNPQVGNPSSALENKRGGLL